MPDGTVPTPAIDELAAEARAYLAEYWDEIAAGRDAHDQQVWWGAARAAALAATRIGPPDNSGAVTDDQLVRAERVMRAYAEIRALAQGHDSDALLASVVVTKVEHDAPTLVALALGEDPGPVDPVTGPSVLARFCSDVAGFLTARSRGLGSDAHDLAGGAEHLERDGWP